MIPHVTAAGMRVGSVAGGAAEPGVTPPEAGAPRSSVRSPGSSDPGSLAPEPSVELGDGLVDGPSPDVPFLPFLPFLPDPPPDPGVASAVADGSEVADGAGAEDCDGEFVFGPPLDGPPDEEPDEEPDPPPLDEPLDEPEVPPEVPDPPEGLAVGLGGELEDGLDVGLDVGVEVGLGVAVGVVDRCTCGAMPGGTLVPALRSCCHDQATDPPAGTTSPPTPWLE